MQAIYKETVQQLAEIYGEPEANSIANILFEDLHQISRIQRLTNPNQVFPPHLLDIHQNALTQLLQHRPVQQVIGYCFFYGMKLSVTEDTLIPRPETEELVDLIIKENYGKTPKILDIGTGSGCIVIALAKGIPGSDLLGWDISENALRIARGNATENHVSVKFEHRDVLTYAGEDNYDIIVSNPPYIPSKEKTAMAENVVRFEPETALFVPDHDPLLFYRKIAELGQKCLNQEGKLYFEIHENYGNDVRDLLQNHDYQNVTIIKDLQGKDRMVSARI